MVPTSMLDMSTSAEIETRGISSEPRATPRTRPGIAKRNKRSSQHADLRARFSQLDPDLRTVLVVDRLAEGIQTRLSEGEDGARLAEITVAPCPGADPVPVLVMGTRPADKAFWLAELEDVVCAAALRGERQMEIDQQDRDILGFFALAVPVGRVSHPETQVLLDAVQQVVSGLALDLQAHFGVDRPGRLRPDLMTGGNVPAQGSFPGHHAAVSFALASVLDSFYPDADGAALRDIAQRIAQNRCHAGLHFPVDTIAGALLGEVVAEALLARLGLAICRDGRRIEAWTGGTINRLGTAMTDLGWQNTRDPLLEMIAADVMRETRGTGQRVV
ncbi:phosphatase PAP2 family protein [Chachezhania sediminis]|uniref:phosphatase PAP2 family protein n=1 Tax=Chachezhania sediminis TaxID=2599291 RepID=UPI00131A643B|nr:phosphatase PAP2 family protein [Chachezhania sediminis]